VATYTDVTIFLRTWPEESAGRMFIQEAAGIAYEYINSALAGTYSVPFSSVPGTIEKISNLLTRAIALALVARGTITIKDIKERSAIDPVEWLEDLRKGKRSIVGVSRVSGGGSWLSTADEMHIFDLDHEIAHDVDPDRLDEIATDREAYP
jgi:phage gp36-like protein